jgi:DNA-binding transcriptional LysR family regulator
MAELGSLTAVARALHIPKSTVARRIERLESELGVALVQRTGRALSLTDDGRALFERCAVSLRELHAVKDTLVDSTAHPTGKLVIALPIVASASPGLIGLVTAFSLKHPGVQLELRELRVNQTGVALLDEGSDVVLQVSLPGAEAVRALDPDYMISRLLGKLSMGLVASPEYLRTYGVPRSLADLANHRCLTTVDSPLSKRWLLRDAANHEQEVQVTASMMSNDPVALTALVITGGGVAIMPSHVSQPYVEQGLLQPLLEEWRPPPLNLHLQWLRSRHLAPRVRAFVDHVQARLGDVRGLLTSGD